MGSNNPSPETTYIDAQVTIGQDTITPFTYEGKTIISQDCILGLIPELLIVKLVIKYR